MGAYFDQGLYFKLMSDNLKRLPSDLCEEDLLNPFWAFSVHAWQTKKVQSVCLTLQAQWSVDVNLLLFAAWLGDNGRVLIPQSDGIQSAKAWHTARVLPARAARLHAKQKETALAIELRAEQIEQAILYTSNTSHPSSDMKKHDLSVHNVQALYPDPDKAFARQIEELISVLLSVGPSR